MPVKGAPRDLNRYGIDALTSSSKRDASVDPNVLSSYDDLASYSKALGGSDSLAVQIS